MASVPPTNGIAMSAMILGFVSIIAWLLAPLALILGIVGYVQARRRGQRGAGMAMTGIVLGALIIAAGLAFVMFVLSFF